MVPIALNALSKIIVVHDFVSRRKSDLEGGSLDLHP